VTDPLETIRTEYAHRRERGLAELYSIWRHDALFRQQELERALLSLLSSQGFNPLGDMRLLDVGCGAGGLLRDFVRYGAAPENLAGVDLLPERVESARQLAPHIDVRVANAAELPFEDDAFDLASAFTVFSSILDPGLRSAVAREILRVLRPGGALIWYDFWTNPVNDAVEGLGLDEVRRLFGRDPVETRRVTLAPPLARRLAPRSLLLCELLGKIPLLRTHWLALIRA
jgi:SAM-dependent methyltransferase